MHAAAAAAELHRMFQVQHFVIDDVFDGVAGNSGMIKNAAHHDGIMGGVVVAKAVAGVVAAPSHSGSSQQAVEESCVEVVENVFQIVSSALGTFDSLAAAHLTNKMSFSGDVLTGNIAAITSRVGSLDRFAVHFGQQNVSDCLQDRVWSAFQQI